MIAPKKKHYAINTLSADGIGVNARIARVVTAASGNIQLVRGQRLGDHFATSALIEIEERCEHQLAALIGRLSPEHHASLIPVEVHNDPEVNRGDVEVVLFSFDQRGIIRNVSEALREVGVSIIQYGANQQPAAHTGSPMFVAKFILRLPDLDKSIMPLADALDRLADEHGYDFDVKSLSSPRLEILRDTLTEHELID